MSPCPEAEHCHLLPRKGAVSLFFNVVQFLSPLKLESGFGGTWYPSSGREAHPCFVLSVAEQQLESSLFSKPLHVTKLIFFAFF